MQGLTEGLFMGALAFAGTISGMKVMLNGMRGDVRDIKADLKDVRSDVSEIKTEHGERLARLEAARR